ncbi:MAG: hydrolase [Conexibacter sp.]|nr:hydrolase [Conexibacter sp.]
MSERESLTPRVVEAVEAQLRRRVSPRALRLAYRVAYLALRPWWFLTRPHTTGMKAVVRCGEEVLLVRHTYARRDQWDIPGGFVRPGEEVSVALHRELGEELGVAPLEVVPIAELPSRFDHKRERLFVFAVEVAAGSEIRPSVAEIAEVRWARHDALPPQTTVFARRMIARSYWELFR